MRVQRVELGRWVQLDSRDRSDKVQKREAPLEELSVGEAPLEELSVGELVGALLEELEETGS